MGKEPKQTEAVKPASAANGADDSQFPSTIVRVLQGVTIEAPTKFRPGHKLSYDEALFASTMHMAAARSAFEGQAITMKDPDRMSEDGSKKIGAATDEQVRTAFASYYNDYVWSARGDSTPLDPVEAEKRKIARAEIQTALKAKKLKIEGKEKWDFAISNHIKKHDARITKAAQTNLAAATANVSEDFLNEIGAQATT